MHDGGAQITELAVSVAAVSVRLFRAEVAEPMVTSFGSLRERPSVIIEIEDVDGTRGWGEVWCNFPAHAAEYRARFIRDVAAPILVGQRFEEPGEAAHRIDRLLGIQAIQAGEEGLLAAVDAGVDQALWDLLARRDGVPLWRFLGGNHRQVRIYASGLVAQRLPAQVAALREAGHTAFKLRLGFSDADDVAAVSAARSLLGDECLLAVDANQAWTGRQAIAVAERLAEFDIGWLEEPIRTDEPLRVWREVSDRSPIPLASGENVRDAHRFAELIESRIVRHIQPDIGKWGGISRCLKVGQRAISAGVTFAPHWQGGGIGLALSLNLVAAVGGTGLAELDVNPNPLRDRFPLPEVSNGTVQLSDVQEGFGFEPDFAEIEEFLVPLS